MDLEQHLLRQMAWSHANFGPGERQEGVLDHIRKEIAEVEEANGAPEEWVDVIILGLDGLTRKLAFPNESVFRLNPNQVAQIVCEMIEEKQTENEGRVWPDWRTADPNRAIEHLKTEGFEKGQIVRYADGPTGFARIVSPHAGGYHADQCLGGGLFVSGPNLRLATETELKEARASKYWVLD